MRIPSVASSVQSQVGFTPPARGELSSMSSATCRLPALPSLLPFLCSLQAVWQASESEVMAEGHTAPGHGARRHSKLAVWHRAVAGATQRPVGQGHCR